MRSDVDIFNVRIIGEIALWIDLFDIKPAHAHICQISVLDGNIENGGLVGIFPPKILFVDISYLLNRFVL